MSATDHKLGQAKTIGGHVSAYFETRHEEIQKERLFLQKAEAYLSGRDPVAFRYRVHMCTEGAHVPVTQTGLGPLELLFQRGHSEFRKKNSGPNPYPLKYQVSICVFVELQREDGKKEEKEISIPLPHRFWDNFCKPTDRVAA